MCLMTEIFHFSYLDGLDGIRSDYWNLKINEIQKFISEFMIQFESEK